MMLCEPEASVEIRYFATPPIRDTVFGAVALSLILLAATVWLVRHRAA